MSPLRCLVVLYASIVAAFAFAEEKGDPHQQVVEIRELLKQRPDDPTLHYYLALSHASLKESGLAVSSLKKVAELGVGFYPVEEFGFSQIAADPAYQAVRADLGKMLPRVDRAPVAFRLIEKKFIPEGIAFDPVGKHFYIGSLAGRGIVRVSMSGKQVPFSSKSDGLRQILGIAIDAKRRALYAVSDSVPNAQGARLNSVVRYDLSTGKITARYDAPGARLLNDIAIGPDGGLYVSDTEGGTVWRLRPRAPAGAKLKRLLPAGTLDGANGIAITADGNKLYLAHSTGIARIDVASLAVEQVAVPARETVAAIDGLYLHHGELFGIQNVTNPGRVVRLGLDQDGRAVRRVETLQSHHNPAFVQPTTAAIAGDAIYVLGTTQISLYEKGKIKDEAKLIQPAVVRIPFSDSVPPPSPSPAMGDPLPGAR